MRGRGHIYNIWLIHVDVWQKPKQHCKAIILQLKISLFFFLKKGHGKGKHSGRLAQGTLLSFLKSVTSAQDGHPLTVCSSCSVK